MAKVSKTNSRLRRELQPVCRELVREWEQQGWTIRELSRAAGVSHVTLHNIKRGGLPTLIILRRIAIALEIHPSVFFREVETR